MMVIRKRLHTRVWSRYMMVIRKRLHTRVWSRYMMVIRIKEKVTNKTGIKREGVRYLNPSLLKFED